jgi:hypothetical protein
MFSICFTMNDFEVIGQGGRDGEQWVRLKESQREMILYCSLAFSKIEFRYHDIKKWEHPYADEPVTEEDRARLVQRITDFHAAKGWDVVIDRKRSFPNCNEILAQSQYDNWAGGICDFCGKRIDRFGQVVPW